LVLNQPLFINGSINVKKFNPPFIKLSKEKCKLLKNGYFLLGGERNENKRFRISLLRWTATYFKNEPIDSVLDCCSALEALLHFPEELRLRIALSVYHILKSHKKESFVKTYKMYGLRNTFIHGDSIPNISDNERRSYIKLIREVLLQIIRDKRIPNIQRLNEKIIGTFS